MQIHRLICHAKAAFAASVGARARAVRMSVERLAADCSGISATEFALVAPVLLTIIFGAVELGRAAYTQGVISFAAQEATRYAVVNYAIDENDVRQLARDCLLGINPDRINAIIVTGPIDPVDHTRSISVEVSYNFEFLMPFLPTGAVAISGTSRAFLIPPPLGAAPAVTGTAIGCGRG